jgi:SAM-dependent methyltransferase
MPAAPKSPLSRLAALPFRAVRRLWRLASDPPYRHVLRFNAKPLHSFQPFNDTRAERYPRIFGFAQQALGADRALAILSFGCSTGEEVFTLRDYFPRAAIKGIDINPGNIALCRKRLARAGGAGLSFEVAGSTAGEVAASYDAIFCMAVLRHGGLGAPGVTRCDHLLRFADFAAAVEDFHRCLKPGGLLAIRHSNFRLCDAPVAAAFDTVLSLRYPEQAKVPIFGADNRLMEGVSYPDTVFRKKRRAERAAAA